MKRKKIVLMIAVCTLGVATLSGCEKTPDDVIVTEKGKDNIANYESTEDTGTKIREMLNIPETYTNEVKSKDGVLTIDTDAKVQVPDVSAIDTVGVSAINMNQDMIDRVTKTLFGDSPIYSANEYYGETKDILQERIDELKKAAAEGNMNPFGYGPDASGNEYDINQAIEELESRLADAPETIEKTEVKPQFGLSYDNYGETWTDEDFFGGVVEMGDALYDYQLKNSRSFMMETDIKATRAQKDGGQYGMWTGAVYNEDATEDELEQQSKTTYEEAKAAADELVSKVAEAVGVDGFELSDWEYEGLYNNNEETGEQGTTAEKIGYSFHYVRVLNGVPITYTMDGGGGVEEMESTTEPWAYELCDVIMSADGMEELHFYNPYQINDVVNENVKLMDFDEIMKSYEDMMLISNADIGDYETERIYHINRITLGYTRIYDPKTDNLSGVLVPVWDFFGGFDATDKETGATDYSQMAENSTQSFMTINAVDGTIIDRGLGY